MKGRKLSLRREVLSELTDHDMRAVAGGTVKTTQLTPALETAYSCMTFISCAVPFCLIDRETRLDCVNTVDLDCVVNTVNC